MKNQHRYGEELDPNDESQSQRSGFCWWRSSEELDENGHLKVEFISDLTPRIKVLREMERVGMIAFAGEGLDDLRHKLITYRSGDFWMPTGGMNKENMAIPTIITLLLVGPIGSGKSSLVNLMYSVLGRSGLIPFAQTSSESSNYTTMYLEEHNVLRSMRSGFCVYDSRGVETTNNRMDEGLEEVKSWMSHGVRHNQLCHRPSDEFLFSRSSSINGAMNPPILLPSSRFIKRPVNYALVVANLAETYKAFKSGDSKPLEALREIFHNPSIKKSNENPILILTHGDMLSRDDRIGGRIKICDYLGIPETTGAYDIPCLTEQGILPDPVTAYALTEAVYRALMQSDRTHVPKKKPKDWVLHFLSILMCSIAAFFSMLAYFFSRLGHKNKLKA